MAQQPPTPSFFSTFVCTNPATGQPRSSTAAPPPYSFLHFFFGIDPVAASCTKRRCWFWPKILWLILDMEGKPMQSQALVDICYFEPFSGSSQIVVDHRRWARTYPRPSRRDALSNDILCGPRRFCQSLRRCTVNRPEVSSFISVRGKLIIIGKCLNVLVCA